MVKLTRAMYPGDNVEFLFWVHTFREPWRGFLERQDEITVEQAIQLGHAVLAHGTINTDDKTFLTALFYAINDHPA